MDGTRALRTAEARPPGYACDRCGTPSGDLPPVEIALLEGAPLKRCDECGLRTLEREGVRLAVSTCRRCGLAFPLFENDTVGRCPDCREGRLPDDLPRDRVAAASEHELRAALSATLRFVALPSTKSDYLTRVARTAAAGLRGCGASGAWQVPQRPVVHLFRDVSLATLALPSGTVLVSTGCLAGLEDEAELAFVLGHELAHAAAGDAAIGLIRIGLHALAASTDAAATEAWTRTATDIMALGYGLDPEHARDLASSEALVRMGYDAAAPGRYLDRLQARVDRGDPAVAATACAHPPAADRRFRIEKHLRARFPAEGPGRTNRELFRRAAGRKVLSSGLRPLPEGLVDTGGPKGAGSAHLRGPVLLTALGIALLASVFLILGFLFAR